MRLWVVRHAAPDVAAGLCYGRLDVPARKEATQAAAQRLAAVLPTRIGVRCSPALRCRQLADALQALLPALSPKIDPRLREMDFGTWEGRSWDTIGQAALQAWTDDFGSHRAGDGECVGDLMLRVGAAFDCAFESPHDVLWITHAGVVRAAGLLARGTREVRQACEWPDAAALFGDWVTFARPAP